MPEEDEGLLKMYMREMGEKVQCRNESWVEVRGGGQELAKVASVGQSRAEEHGYGLSPAESEEAETNLNYVRKLGAPLALNFFTNMDAQAAEAFNEYMQIFGSEALYDFKIGDFPSIVSEDQAKELQPKLCSALRHGTPVCPAPMCHYVAPITRITNMLTIQQRASGGFVPTASQILQTCMRAWDPKAGALHLPYLRLQAPDSGTRSQHQGGPHEPGQALGWAEWHAHQEPRDNSGKLATDKQWTSND